MQKLISALIFFCILHSAFCLSHAADTIRPVPTTAYTRGLLTNATAAASRTYLEIVEGGGGLGYVFDPNSFVVVNGSNVFLITGGSYTNPIFVGNIISTMVDVGGSSGTFNVDAARSSEFSMRLTGNATIGLTNWSDWHAVNITVTNTGNFALTFTNVMFWIPNQNSTPVTNDFGVGAINVFHFYKATGGNILASEPERAGGAAGATGANPTAAIGLATVNGVSPFFLRADAAQRLDVTIAPLWAGQHEFGLGIGVGTNTEAVYNELFGGTWLTDNTNGLAFSAVRDVALDGIDTVKTLLSSTPNVFGLPVARYQILSQVSAGSQLTDLAALSINPNGVINQASLQARGFNTEAGIQAATSGPHGSTSIGLISRTNRSFLRLTTSGPAVIEVSGGSGSPEGVVSGNPGDLWLRNNGGASTALYVKESGTATTTGWVAYGAAGGSAPVGTMVESGISAVGTVPAASDTSGTNYSAAPIVVWSGTNVNFTGRTFADRVTGTNGFATGNATYTSSGASLFNSGGAATVVNNTPTDDSYLKLQGGTGVRTFIQFTAGGAGGNTARGSFDTNGQFNAYYGQASAYGIFTNIGALKLVRTDSDFKLAAASLTAGASFDGTTLKGDSLFGNASIAQVASTTTESSCIPTVSFLGSATLPANYLIAGKTLHIHLRGYIGSTATPTLRLRFKAGATLLADTGAFTMVSSATLRGIDIDLMFTCFTTGAAGNTLSSGRVNYFSAANVMQSVDFPDIAPTAGTAIDTTASQALTVTAEWGTANALNDLRINHATMTTVY